MSSESCSSPIFLLAGSFSTALLPRESISFFFSLICTIVIKPNDRHSVQERNNRHSHSGVIFLLKLGFVPTSNKREYPEMNHKSRHHALNPVTINKRNNLKTLTHFILRS
ncbi:unnamed protein product (plasmid) [Klebsiella pneumoniae]|nr:unnamed protein product [Klebsiella pneumoniae]